MHPVPPNDAPWRPEFSVGNPLLDEEHRHLLQLCIESERLLANPAESAALHAVLNDLMVYANRHFETEERLLRQAGYPDLAEQEREHHGYRESVAHLHWQAVIGPINAPALRSFLLRWWTFHITGSDMKYKDFLAAHGGTDQG